MKEKSYHLTPHHKATLSYSIETMQPSHTKTKEENKVKSYYLLHTCSDFIFIRFYDPIKKHNLILLFFYVFLYVVSMTKRTPQLFVFIVLLQYSRTELVFLSYPKKKSKYIIIWWQAMCICKTYNITIAEVIEFFAFKLVCYVFCCFVCCILNLILILKINHIDETSEV